MNVLFKALLALALFHVGNSQSFTTETLRTAVTAWCDDPGTAEITYGSIGGWDTSEVTDMSYLFCQSVYCPNYCSTGNTFNGDITNWDTGKVTNMKWMFYECYEFNQGKLGELLFACLSSCPFIFTACLTD